MVDSLHRTLVVNKVAHTESRLNTSNNRVNQLQCFATTFRSIEIIKCNNFSLIYILLHSNIHKIVYFECIANL